MTQLLLIIVPWLGVIQPGVEYPKHPQAIEVTVFLACECPISQKYIPLLNSVYSIYKESAGFKWSFVIPGKTRKSEINSFVQEFDVRFPLVADPRGSKVKQLHARTTPQVIIVKDSIVYTGAIDNWFYGLGQYRREATEHYLVDALEALSVGRAPAVRETEAIGCPIATSH